MADNKDQKNDPSEEKDAIEQAEQEAKEAEEKADELAETSSPEEAPVDDEATADAEEESTEAPAEVEASEEAAPQEEAATDEAATEEAATEEASAEQALATESGDVKTYDAGDVVEAHDPIKGIAAYFDLPDDLMHAAAMTRDAKWDKFDAYSPFPIHGMDDAMGLGRSWIPWVTFGAGSGGFLTANALQFGTMSFDWPMIIGGKPFAPWPSFVPIMFELTVLLAGVTTGVVMLIAAGCFRKPFIIDREITNDRFVLWISADDDNFDPDEVTAFMESLNPVEIRTITKGA